MRILNSSVINAAMPAISLSSISLFPPGSASENWLISIAQISIFQNGNASSSARETKSAGFILMPKPKSTFSNISQPDAIQIQLCSWDFTRPGTASPSQVSNVSYQSWEKFPMRDMYTPINSDGPWQPWQLKKACQSSCFKNYSDIQR